MFGKIEKDVPIAYPLIKDLIDKGFFSPIDYYFATTFTKGVSLQVIFFLCYLMKISREGNLCFSIADKIDLEITPYLIKGIQDCPKSLIQIVDDTEIHFHKPICRFNNSFYLQRNWVLETKIYHHLTSLLTSSGACFLNEDVCLDFIQNQTGLNEKQQKALYLIKDSPLSLICGGPGTGKTFIAIKIIEMVKAASIAKIAICAPTGKAAFHLKSKLQDYPGIQVTTIHSLLSQYRDSPILVDCLIIDEASMIDVKLMTNLLSKIKDKTKVVLIGDPDQLPSVEPGSIFFDLTEVLQSCIKLDKAIRFEKPDILQFAQMINSSDAKNAIDFLSQSDDVKLLDIDIESEEFLDYIDPYLFDEQQVADPVEAIEKLEKFRILSCLRQGSSGVDRLNKKIYEHQKNSQKPIPILITKNNHEMELYNGMVGVIISNKAYFYDKELRSFALQQLPSYEYAYVLSVHKSQGSEYDHVVMIIPKGSENFGKQVLYTGITRAKKRLEIIGEKEVLKKTIEKNSIRVSNLKKRLKGKEKISFP